MPVPHNTAITAQRVIIAAAFALVLVLAIALRFITYERHLPVLEHVDETFRFIHAYQVRPDAPLGDQYGTIEWTAGFPPVQVWVGVGSQRLVERFVQFPFPPDYIRALRAFSAALNVGTTVFLALTGWLLGRRLGTVGAAATGFFAALVWAVGPRIVGTGNLALMDPLIFPMTAAALFFTVYAIQTDSAWATVASLVAVILAIYTKYVLVYALWLPACAAAVLVYRRRWRALPWIGTMAVISAATAGWLVWGHGALGLENREAEMFYAEGIANMLSLRRNGDNLLYTLQETTGAILFGVVLLAGIAAWVMSRRRGLPTVNAAWLLVLLPYALGCLLLTSSVDVLRDWHEGWYRVRYTLPAAQALLLIFGACIAQVGAALYSHPRSFPRQQGQVNSVARSIPLRRAALLGVLFAIITAPAVITNVALAREYRQENTYVRVWDWSDSSIPNPEGKIITSAGSFLTKAWNRPWVGYNRPTTFAWVHDENPAGRTPQSFWDEGITYFAATDDDMENKFIAPEMEPWLDELFLLKTIPPAEIHNVTTYFYRLLPPQVQTDVRFGEHIRLVGYDLEQAAGAITLRPFWQADATPPTNYSMFVHLLPAGETQPIAQFDGAPASDKRLPVTWTDADEVLLGTQAVITLPGDVPPGDYTLAVGLYDFQTGARLMLPDGGDSYTLPVTLPR